jgi:hypothetical protein
VLAVVSIGSGIIGATADRSETATHRELISPFYAPAKVIETTPTSEPLQAGYRGVENFCAVAPLTGTIHYDGTNGHLVGAFTVNVEGLPPDEDVNINWSNNYVRASVVAALQTNSTGGTVQSSVIVARLAEVRGVEIVLGAATVPNQPLGRLEPC